MKIISLLILMILLTGCAHQRQLQTVTLYTFIYPPYTDYGPSGLFIDLITEAYKTQGVAVKFDFNTLERSIKKAKANKGLMLASRRYQAEYAQEIGFEEFYNATTQLISIAGRSYNKKLGTFSEDEVIFAKENQLIPVKYVKPSDGLKLLYQGKVGSIICTDISCDQIELSNPNVHFKLAPGYSFPVDLVYFGKTPSAEVENALALLKTGTKAIVENGKYSEIQSSYKISNPIFQIPLEELIHVKVKE